MNTSSNTSDPTESPSENTRPAASFKGSGGIQVAVWKNKSEQGFDNYSVRIERAYRDGQDGPFKTTPYLRDSDLLRAAKLVEEADYWIEADKSKQRSSAASRG